MQFNKQISIKRPQDYQRSAPVQGSRPLPQLRYDILRQIGVKIIKNVVEDNEWKVFLGGLPLTLDELSVINELQLERMG